MSMSVVGSHANSAHSAAGTDKVELRAMKYESVRATRDRSGTLDLSIECRSSCSTTVRKVFRLAH